MEAQKKQILHILKSGKKITSIDGLMMGIVRVTNRIGELRKAGHSIQDKWMLSKSKKRYKVYYMAKFFDESRL